MWRAISAFLLIVGIAAGFALLCSFAQAQEAAKTFTLTVTNQDLQVLSAALDELPRKVSEPVVVKLQQQLVGQMAPSPAQIPGDKSHDAGAVQMPKPDDTKK